MSIRTRILGAFAAATAFTRATLEATAPKTPCSECDLPKPSSCVDCPVVTTVKQRAVLAEASLLVEGKAVPEPKAAARSTTASRREARTIQDNRRDIHGGAHLHINRAQRRALAKLQGRK